MRPNGEPFGLKLDPSQPSQLWLPKANSDHSCFRAQLCLPKYIPTRGPCDKPHDMIIYIYIYMYIYIYSIYIYIYIYIYMIYVYIYYT